MKTLVLRLVGFVIIIVGVGSLSLDRVRAKNISQAKEIVLQAELRGVDVHELVDSLVRAVDFQFIPATLNGQVNGIYSIYKYRNVHEFPLWATINMNTPLAVDEMLFTVNSMEQKEVDGVLVWLLNISCQESVNGKFDLQFVIEVDTGKTMLDIIQTEKGEVAEANDRGEETYKKEDSYLFQGYIFPKQLLYSYKNEKQEQRAIRSQELLNDIVPSLDFRLSNSRRAITINPTILERKLAKLIYMDKFNDKWYIRIEYPAGKSRKLKTPVTDFVIDTRTGESYVRGGVYDRLKKNWQHYEKDMIFANPN